MPGTKRQRELARRRAERQSVRRREAAIRRRKRRLVVGGTGLGVLALVLAAFFIVKANRDDKSTGTAASASDAPSASAPNRAVACGATAPNAGAPQKFDRAPPLTIDPVKKYIATIKTSCGDVVVNLLADKAPTTVNSFNFLASKKYFDGTRCHRILAEGDFVLQCGDPTATGGGGPGYEFKDENLPKATGDTFTYQAGTVAMANAGAGTNGSQFFFVVKDSPFPPNYSIFGTVAKGQDVLDKLLAVGVAAGTQDEPAQNMFIESYTVTAS